MDNADSIVLAYLAYKSNINDKKRNGKYDERKGVESKKRNSLAWHNLVLIIYILYCCRVERYQIAS